jgi:hypothetical protein
MDLKSLKDLPPWDWPADADKMLLGILLDEQADASDRLLAVSLAGDYTVINDELANALISIVRNAELSEEMRATAAISLGPALEHVDIEEFEDPDDILITEGVFHRIQELFYSIYTDNDTPKEVRRRVLEASVRAPQDWHEDAIHTAYSTDDEDWKLTAVFCMQYIRGFDEQILEALDSENSDIEYEAVCAAGNWKVDAAWKHVANLVTSHDTEKSLLLAAIEAAVGIRPEEAPVIIVDLTQSDDEDIVEAAYDAIAMAKAIAEGPDHDEDDDDELIH